MPTNTLNQSIGAALRARRQEAGLAQSEVAARAGTSQSALSRIESGESEPSLSRLSRIAAALGCVVEVSFPKAERKGAGRVR